MLKTDKVSFYGVFNRLSIDELYSNIDTNTQFIKDCKDIDYNNELYNKKVKLEDKREKGRNLRKLSLAKKIEDRKKRISVRSSSAITHINSAIELLDELYLNTFNWYVDSALYFNDREFKCDCGHISKSFLTVNKFGTYQRYKVCLTCLDETDIQIPYDILTISRNRATDVSERILQYINTIGSNSIYHLNALYRDKYISDSDYNFLLHISRCKYSLSEKQLKWFNDISDKLKKQGII